MLTSQSSLLSLKIVLYASAHALEWQTELGMVTNSLQKLLYWTHARLVYWSDPTTSTIIDERVCFLVLDISAMSHTNATGLLRNRSKTMNRSRCSLGPWNMASFREIPSLLVDASNTFLVFVVSFSGLVTAKWGKYHYSRVFFSVYGTFLIYPLASYWLITSE